MTSLPPEILARRDEYLLSTTSPDPTFELSEVHPTYQKLIVAAIMKVMPANTLIVIGNRMAGGQLVNLGIYFSQEILEAVGLPGKATVYNIGARLPEHIGFYRWLSQHRRYGSTATELLKTTGN